MGDWGWRVKATRLSTKDATRVLNGENICNLAVHRILMHRCRHEDDACEMPKIFLCNWLPGRVNLRALSRTPSLAVGRGWQSCVAPSVVALIFHGAYARPSRALLLVCVLRPRSACGVTRPRIPPQVLRAARETEMHEQE